MKLTVSYHDPAQMPPDDRLDEVAEILAIGLIRHRRKKREKPLAPSRPDSAHGRETSQNGSDHE